MRPHFYRDTAKRTMSPQSNTKSNRDGTVKSLTNEPLRSDGRRDE
jgi:hypothetical protein